ncbi:MAG: hypothetical protein KY439_00050 [Actinobacteria bacterium]|nr:hypothetical protein [Actinomycetota bacterium]
MSRRGDEAGAVLVFVTIWTLTLLVATGLLYEGGLILAAQRRAFAVAELAAQAGGQALDPASLRAADGAVLLDPDRASQEVQAYLDDAGYEGTVTATEELVTVRVRVAQPVGLLGLVGLGPVEVVGVGTSRPVSGTTREGD